MTNGDKIRSMTNEEMAIVLKGDGLIRYCVAPNEEYCELAMAGLNSGFCDDDCYDCILKWLNSEVKIETNQDKNIHCLDCNNKHTPLCKYCEFDGEGYM